MSTCIRAHGIQEGETRTAANTGTSVLELQEPAGGGHPGIKYTCCLQHTCLHACIAVVILRTLRLSHTLTTPYDFPDATSSVEPYRRRPSKRSVDGYSVRTVAGRTDDGPASTRVWR